MQILEQLQVNGDIFFTEKNAYSSDTWDWFVPQVDDLGINRYMASRLIPEDNYATEESK